MAEAIFTALFMITTFSLAQSLLGAVCLRAAVNISASETVSFKRSYLLNLLIWTVVFSVGVILSLVTDSAGPHDTFSAILFSSLILCFIMHVVVTRLGVDVSFLQSVGSTLLVGLFSAVVWGIAFSIVGTIVRLS